MKRVRFVAPARWEFLSAVDHYERQEAGLGKRFLDVVEDATARAATFPRAGVSLSLQARRVFVRNFPYAVVYRLDSDGLLVLAVCHLARQPDYWQSRVQESGVLSSGTAYASGSGLPTRQA